MPRTRRKWGQHWLASDQLAARLIEGVRPVRDATVLEIGPGTGRLTSALLAAGARVVAVEVDPRCATELRTWDEHDDRLQVIEGDVLDLDPGAIAEGKGLRVVGNLPYYIGAAILRWTRQHRDAIVDAHYMLPGDVVRRMTATAAEAEYGALSVLVQTAFRVETLMHLSPGAFRPPPEIDSAFVRLTTRVAADDAPGSAADCHHVDVIRGAFAHRRKTLANSLALSGWSRAQAVAACARADIDPGSRAQRLAPGRFAALARGLPPRRQAKP